VTDEIAKEALGVTRRGGGDLFCGNDPDTNREGGYKKGITPDAKVAGGEALSRWGEL